MMIIISHTRTYFLICYTYIIIIIIYSNIILPEVGFEPTHPKITELKSAALDHSAIQAYLLLLLLYILYILYHMIIIITIINNISRWRDSNSRPPAYNEERRLGDQRGYILYIYMS